MPSLSARSWFVVGFLASGVAVLVWAAWSAYQLSGTHSLVAYLTLFHVLFVVLVWARHRWYSVPRSVPIGPLTREEQSEREQSEALFRDARVLLAAVWLVVALISCVPAWRVVYQALREEPTARFLDFTAPALTLGWTMVMAALIMLVLVTTPSPERARRLRVISAAGGLAAGAATAALVFVSTTILPVEATTAEAPSPEDVAAPPARVSGVGWRWQTPEDAGVVTTVAAGGGVAVLLEDGVVLLDTGTGEERWRYRRADERTDYVSASPDGSVLIVVFGARNHSGEPRPRLVVLDAHTGRIRSEHQAPGEHGDDYRGAPAGVRATATTYIAAGLEDQERGFAAFHLDSGETAWRYEPPDGCGMQDHLPRPALEEVVVVMTCNYSDSGPIAYDILVVGLDPDDGEELWRHEEAPPDGAYELEVEASPDRGGVFMLEWLTGLDEIRLENVFLGGGGEEIARDLEWSDLSLAEEWGGGRHRSLTGDGPLMYGFGSVDDEFVRYVWFGFGGAERTASVDFPELPSRQDDIFADVLVLQDMVVVARVQDPDGRPPTSMTVTVTAEPWEDTEGVRPARFDVEVGHDDAVTGDWRWTSLRLTPGAVVLTRRGAHEVVGLQ